MMTASGNPAPPHAWLLLIVSLPTASATARMRVWRSLKAAGAAALRDGAYLLPEGAAHESAMQDLAQTCLAEGGHGWLMNVTARTADDDAAYTRLFDRSQEYAELRLRWKEAGASMASMSGAELLRLQRRLQRELDAVQAIDFFPGLASTEAQAAWDELHKRLTRAASPDEPGDAEGMIARLDVAQYQGRTWATRKRLWVDRVASAWLIARFIDSTPTFRWLDKPSACPKSALGFDFDGATFTHVGERVTFETLLASFGLEQDPALARLAAMVHFLDVGGEPVAEAGGFEAVMSGARERLTDDDMLLGEMSAVLDSLYAHFARPAQDVA